MENAIWNWKDADVHSLIKLRTEKNGLFTGKRGTAKRNWEEIAAKLAIGASGHQCKKKWENLVTKYKTIIIPTTGEGLEERDHDANCWVFFDAMNRFMSDRHTIKPILTLQSATTPRAFTSTADHTSSSSILIPSPHPSPTSTDSNLSFASLPALHPTSYTSTSPHYPSSASAAGNHPSSSTTAVINRPSTSSTPTPPPRPSSASAIYNHSSPLLCYPDVPSGSQSGSSSYSGEDSVLEDSASVVSMRNPRKRRRTESQSNDRVITELMAQIKAEMEESRKQQEEARKNEKYMLDILKSILNKK